MGRAPRPADDRRGRPAGLTLTSQGPASVAARAEFREIAERKGHVVDNARRAIDRLEAAFAGGALQRTDELDQSLSDLRRALASGEGQKLGGKSAEAARFILRAIGRQIEDA